MGAWIEITEGIEKEFREAVAPFVGAWIEISKQESDTKKADVAPFVGAWIEISEVPQGRVIATRRSLRGSVD